MSFPALVIGEALIDVICRPGEPPSAHVGGSPLNVAIGLGRLGASATLLTQLGDDPHGAMIEQHLAANRVDLFPGSIGSGTTSTATANIAADGSASYHFDLRWDLEPVERPEILPTAVHTGSIGALLEPGAQVASSFAASLRPSATISYDPNVRPQLMGEHGPAVQRIEASVTAADVVKASDEDLEWLYPGAELTAVARCWLNLGPALVVVTRGAEGAYAVGRGGTIDLPAPRSAVIDTIGAGDSFMAGLLVALADRGLLGRGNADRLRTLDHDDLREVIGFAAACSAITVSRPGANPPTRGDLAR